ncbi:hypothetical protein Taro_019312 [Colocasia esculenta]|uniref:BSD domain-containing protein n=1 Tax=Colocasia esculenta TaxID=4460 RepID=A0A843V1U5_COLES|nr:hypothetical protein [Colocasia esculenta]
MDLWQRAKVFAEDAAKRSQEISKVAAQRSQELTKGAAKFSQEFVTETAKRSKELAAEASKKADLIKVEALKRADQIKSLAGEIPVPIPPLVQSSSEAAEQSPDLESFGITDELREFLKGITLSTFRDFPMEGGYSLSHEPEISDVPMLSNVRQDLNEWQATHATLVLSSVKEISKFRYELCPRSMKERKFWRIYFVLVNGYVAPYEKQYMESKPKETQQENETSKETSTSVAPTPGDKEAKLQSKSSTTEQDLDVFLLGDGSSDEGPAETTGINQCACSLVHGGDYGSKFHLLLLCEMRFQTQDDDENITRTLFIDSARVFSGSEFQNCPKNVVSRC